MRTKKALFLLLLLVLLFPLLQSTFHLIEERPLADVAANSKTKPDFSIQGWLDGSFQDTMTAYVEENWGNKPWNIRLVNQLDYSLFNATHAPGITIGKDGYLFVESYIDDYTGKTFRGKETLQAEIDQLKAADQYLRERGKSLIIVFGPGKASYYPEYIPNRYHHGATTVSNYSCYSELLGKSGLNFIDFNSYFPSQKAHSPYPVYSKTGTHWSFYAQAVAIDSIARYIEQLRGIQLPARDWSNIEVTDQLNILDMDVEAPLNLIQTLHHDPMPYPKFTFNETGKTKPSLLAISDSYWWCFVGNDIPEHLFAKDEYWFYNRDIVLDNRKQEKGVAAIEDYKAAVLDHDIVLLMATEATLNTFPFGFTEKFNGKATSNVSYEKLDHAGKLNYWIEEMRKNEEWMKALKKKASERNTSLESVMHEDAEYMIQTKEAGK